MQSFPLYHLINAIQEWDIHCQNKKGELQTSKCSQGKKKLLLQLHPNRYCCCNLKAFCLTSVRVWAYLKYPHVTVLFLVLNLGYLVLLLLQLLGHLQVLLHQAALMDVGSQVTFDCRHKKTSTALKGTVYTQSEDMLLYVFLSDEPLGCEDRLQKTR